MGYEWTLRSFGDGELLFRQGDVADGAYVLRYGEGADLPQERRSRNRTRRHQPGRDLRRDGARGRAAALGIGCRGGRVEVEFIGKGELKARVPDETIWKLLQNMGSRLREMDDAFQKLETEQSTRRDVTLSITERRSWVV